MFDIIFENMQHKKTYSYENENVALTLWGQFYDTPEFPLKKKPSKNYDFLNFDGAYVALWVDKRAKKQVIFKSHLRTFDLYYLQQGQELIFSDSFYTLVSKLKTATWNLRSISDYFEAGWNHICKYDRTPLKEIKKLDSCCFIEITDYTTQIKQKSWKKDNYKIVYNEKNLDAFEKAFFETLDYYLDKIHNKEKEVAISLSSGIDTNTIAAEWSKRFPHEKTIFFTSKINDVTDESTIASSMQQKISADIQYIDIKTDETNLIEQLKLYMRDFVPPRFLNVLSEQYFDKQLIQKNITMPYLSGMGADGLFGEFGGEYRFLMDEYLEKGLYEKARHIFKAIQISFVSQNKTDDEINAEFDNIVKKCRKKNKFYKKICRGIKRLLLTDLFHKSKTIKEELLRVALPQYLSSSIKNHKEALRYASYSGGTVDQSLLLHHLGLTIYHPYGGGKFYDLKSKCDPFIFSDEVNKSCLRYAVRNLLPKEILENRQKQGQPGVTYQKVFKANKERVLDYLKHATSDVVNMQTLITHLENDQFSLKEFLSLSLVVFEDILKSKYRLSLIVPAKE